MKSPVTIVRRVFIFLLILFSASFVAPAQDEYASMKNWVALDFASKSVKPAEMNALAIDDLKLVRGVVFGKHGRVFKDPDIRRFLESRSWFKADPNFSNAKLNDTERKNLDVIRIAEAQNHVYVEPGDMRLYQNRALTRKKLGEHTTAEWTVLASEIEAIHGKRFDD